VRVGIDWSGDRRAADRPHPKLWWAEATDDGLLIRLEPTSRAAVREELLARRDEVGLVVGIDAGFGYPAWFVDAVGCASGRELWGAAGEVAAWAAARRGPFWGWAGSRRPDGVELFRETEVVARRAGWGVRSVFQLAGAGSVGTGTLTVLPTLAALDAAGIGVWPFSSPAAGRPVVTEVYPRSFAPQVVKSRPEARAGHVDATWPNLDRSRRDLLVGSDDAFDAAVVACGLVGAVPPPALPANEVAAIEGEIWFPVHAE